MKEFSYIFKFNKINAGSRSDALLLVCIHQSIFALLTVRDMANVSKQKNYHLF